MFDALKKEMERRHITGYWLAKKTGISSPDVYAALNGTKPMYPGYKIRIAEAMDCSVEELFPATNER